MKKFLFIFVVMFLILTTNANASVLVSHDYISDVDSLTLYPVPLLSHGQLTLIINFPTTENFSVSAYNIMGERVYKEDFVAGTNKVLMNMEKASRGTHCIYVTSKSFTIKRLFVKK